MKEAFWIIDQLVQQGVTHFCLAPGSRSTPLAIAAADHKGATLHVHYDERGLGFYALGIQNAAVIVTSGTAVGNLLPAVMEAHHSCTPLILLTADRPVELRDCSANQATDQVKIFGSFVRSFLDLPPGFDEETIRSIAANSYFQAHQNPPGPVQINGQFREPLYVPHPPLPYGKPIHIELPRLKAKPVHSPYAKGLILVGRLPEQTDISPILEMAKRLKWPVCADLLSNARSHPTEEQILHFDHFSKERPDQVLHFGERLTSKRMLEWLKAVQPDSYLHISPFPFLQDPTRLLTGRIQSHIPEFCTGFQAKTDANWLRNWREKDRETGERIDACFNEQNPFTEAHAMREMAPKLPAHFALYLGSGMPIRDANHFLFPAKCAAVYANRGLSGIDGNIATLAGIAERAPVVGFIGDQAALYDLNSLPLLKKTKYPVILVISNNFGGGIFSHLPVSQSPHFEALFAASHNYRFEHAAKLFGLPYRDFSQLQFDQTAVYELVTSREENHRFLKELTAACSTARV